MLMHNVEDSWNLLMSLVTCTWFHIIEALDYIIGHTPFTYENRTTMVVGLDFSK